MIIIASTKTGYVGPWFLDEKPPEDFVEVPSDVFQKYKSGEIKDGFELAQKALAVKAGYVEARDEKPAIKIPLPPKEEKKPTKLAELEKALEASSLFPETSKKRA